MALRNEDCPAVLNILNPDVLFLRSDSGELWVYSLLFGFRVGSWLGFEPGARSSSRALSSPGYTPRWIYQSLVRGRHARARSPPPRVRDVRGAWLELAAKPHTPHTRKAGAKLLRCDFAPLGSPFAFAPVLRSAARVMMIKVASCFDFESCGSTSLRGVFRRTP